MICPAFSSLLSVNDLLAYIGNPPDGIVFVFERQSLYQIEGCSQKSAKILYVIEVTKKRFVF
jgi:hypothetical protein